MTPPIIRAAVFRSRSINCSAASITARPATSVARDATVGPESATVAVSTSLTRIRSGWTHNASDATARVAASAPCPISVTPIRTFTVPSACSVTVAPPRSRNSPPWWRLHP